MAALIISCIFGTVLVFYGTYSWLKWTTEREEATLATVNRVQVAAIVALNQASANHSFFVAICKRFNRDEKISADIAQRRDDLEKRYPHAGVNSEYRRALVELLAENAKRRNDVVGINCPKAMTNAYAGAQVTALPTSSPAPIYTKAPYER